MSIGTWNLELLWCLVLEDWCLRKTLRPPTLHFPLRAPRLEKPRFSRGGANPSKTKSGGAGEKDAKLLLQGGKKTREKNAKPRRARRILLFADSLMQTPGRNSTKACQQSSKRSADLSPRSALGRRSFRPLVVQHCWRTPQTRCHAFADRPATCGTIAEHRTNKRIRSQHPPGRNQFALPTAAHSQALARDNKPNRKRDLVRFVCLLFVRCSARSSHVCGPAPMPAARTPGFCVFFTRFLAPLQQLFCKILHPGVATKVPLKR